MINAALTALALVALAAIPTLIPAVLISYPFNDLAPLTQLIIIALGLWLGLAVASVEIAFRWWNGRDWWLISWFPYGFAVGASIFLFTRPSLWTHLGRGGGPGFRDSSCLRLDDCDLRLIATVCRRAAKFAAGLEAQSAAKATIFQANSATYEARRAEMCRCRGASDIETSWHCATTSCAFAPVLALSVKVR